MKPTMVVRFRMAMAWNAAANQPVRPSEPLIASQVKKRKPVVNVRSMASQKDAGNPLASLSFRKVMR